MNLSGFLSRQDLTEIPPVESPWKRPISLLLHSHLKIYISYNISLLTKNKRRIRISTLFSVYAVIPVIMFEGEDDIC